MRSLLKRLLSAERRESIKKWLGEFDRNLLPFFAKSRWLSSLYYLFFSREFAREHQAVLKGRISYYRAQANKQSSSVMLRRNTHRLEKGLIMRPQRDIFAQGYISETVDCFVQCERAGTLNAGEKKWAKDVLTRYFSVVGSSDVIDRAKKEFFAVADNQNSECTQSNKEQQSIPYEHKDIVRSDVSIEQFKQLCIQRRSVRWYEEKAVPRELIEQAMTAATLAPSACNRQPFEFFVFDKPTDAQEIGDIAMGTVGFSHNFQCMLVVVGDLAAYPFERDRHVIYIDGSLASMQLMLALETLGLSSCVINWPDVEPLEKRMEHKLQLPPNKRPLMLISVGYADKSGKIPFSDKKTPQQLIKEVSL
ncbi:MAG: nitroreductase family protein [Psychrobium sp.]